MKVLMVGTYAINRQPKSLILKEGLKYFGVTVDTAIYQDRFKYLKIIKSLLTDNYDVIFATGHYVLLLAKIFSRKPVLYDIYISAHDTLVLDRKLYNKNSFIAKLIFFLDKLTCKIADVVTIDTKEYAKYFVKNYGLNPSKVKVIYLGAYDKKFHPFNRVKKNQRFTILFHGTFIPVHGIEYIIKAAKLLEKHQDINFILIGKGQTRDQMKNLIITHNVTNVTLPGYYSDDKLINAIASSDICLGMFGITPKNPRVISNKVFEYLAMKKPLVTGDCPATREFLISGENCILCKPGSPKSLADAILQLKNNPKMMAKISVNGYNLFKERFSIEKTSQIAKEVLEYTVNYGLK